MKHIIITFLFLLTINGYSQNSIDFVSCKDSTSYHKCFKKNLENLIKSKVNDSIYKEFIDSKKDTLFIYSSLRFSNSGKIIKNESYFDGNFSSIRKQLNNEVNNFQQLIYNDFFDGNDGIESFRNKHFFLPNSESKNFTLLDNIDEDKYLIGDTKDSKFPVYPGCAIYRTNKELRRCMNKNIANHIVSKFDTDIADWIGKDGVIKIKAIFKVDKKGRVFDINANAENFVIISQTKKVIRLLPNMESPAFIDGNATVMSFAIPIKFIIEPKNSLSTKN